MALTWVRTKVRLWDLMGEQPAASRNETDNSKRKPPRVPAEMQRTFISEDLKYMIGS